MAARDFADKVALVTGAGGGIGRAAARLLAARGAAVACADIDAAAAAETARQIEAAGGRACMAPVDVADEASNVALVEACEREFGRLDVAFLNAGILRRGTVMGTPASVFDEVIAVNLRGVFLGMRAAVPALRRAGGGAIVVTASSVALRADADLACYSASKHGLIGLVQAAAGEMAPWNIRVNAICPGAVATPMAGTDHGPGSALAMVHPIGRIGTPEDIAELVAFLAGPGAGFITGAAYPVDGGLTALSVPRFRVPAR